MSGTIHGIHMQKWGPCYGRTSKPSKEKLMANLIASSTWKPGWLNDEVNRSKTINVLKLKRHNESSY